MNDPLVKDAEFTDDDFDTYDSFGAKIREMEKRLDILWEKCFPPTATMDPREIGGVVTTEGLGKRR